MYDLPPEIDVRADGALRIITLNRPDSLNSVNDALHVGLAHVWTRLGEDREARAAVITGAGRAFSAGGDFAYLEELRQDPDCAPRPSCMAAKSCWAWPAAESRWSRPSMALRSVWAAAWWR